MPNMIQIDTTSGQPAPRGGSTRSASCTHQRAAVPAPPRRAPAAELHADAVVLPMKRRSKSSARWLKQHFADPFVQKAHSEGWRSRAVFKLEEIDRRARLLKPGAVCLDLGAAPGAWSQYAARRVGGSGRVVATDILPMPALPGVEFVHGDFREPEIFDQVLGLLPDRQVDVLLSDMAPTLSG